MGLWEAEGVGQRTQQAGLRCEGISVARGVSGRRRAPAPGSWAGIPGTAGGEKHHLCLQTIETPSQAVSLLSPPPPPQPPSPPPWPRVGTASPLGRQGVLDGRFGGSGSKHQFPSSLFPSHQESLYEAGNGGGWVPRTPYPDVPGTLAA